MSIPARVAWVATALLMIAGVASLFMLTEDRSDASEEFQRAIAEEKRLDDEIELQAGQIDEAEQKETVKEEQRTLCLREMLEQTRDWNQLLEEMPTVFYSTPEIQSYQDKGMALVEEARGAKAVCARI